jgi:hypothetical protein
MVGESLVKETLVDLRKALQDPEDLITHRDPSP